MTTTDPSIAHNNHINDVMEKLQGKPLVTPLMAPDDRADAATAELVAQEKAQTTAQSTPAPTAPPSADAPSAAEGRPPVVEASPPPVVAPAKQPSLSRSLEIQRRSANAQRRAREAVARLRTAEPAKPDPQPAAPPAARPQAAPAPQASQQIADIRAQLEAEIRLARTNPFEFARRHGVTNKDFVDFARGTADHNQRAIEQLRQEAAKAIQQVKDDFGAKFKQVADAFNASEEQRVQHNFFTFVEEAKEANPDSFPALNSGLVLSDKEVWDTASRLMDERADLQDNFDEDKLLEAVEAEAQKDPRWPRVKALLTKSGTSSKQSSSQGNASQSNARAKEVEAPAAPKALREAPSAPRAPNGQFLSRSPHESHATHVEAVIRQMRFGR